MFRVFWFWTMHTDWVPNKTHATSTTSRWITVYLRADDKLCNICSHRSQPRVPILGRPGRSIRRSWARPATSSPAAAPSRHSKRPSQTHPSTQTICPSRSSRSILIRVPCRPNKKNSTVKTDQNQLNKKSTHQKSIHQNVNFTTFELNKSQLNKWPIQQMPIHQSVNSTSQQKSPE